MIFTTSGRLKYLSKWMDRILNDLHTEEDYRWRKLLQRVGLASALNSFSLGWDEVEYPKIVGWLRDQEEDSLSGSSRRLLRIYFWQFLDSDTAKASWLSYILQTFSHTSSTISAPREFKEYQGAELILCLFGPAEGSSVDGELSQFKNEALTRLMGRPDFAALEQAFLGGYHEAKNIFADLGKALSTLLKSSSISKRYLASLIDAMFNSFYWHIDNQAACLLFSCEKLVKIYLSFIVRRNKGMERYAHLLSALVAVCGRLSNNLDQGLDKILDWAVKLPDTEEMEAFVEAFWSEFAARIREEHIPVEVIHQLGSLVTLSALRVPAPAKGKVLASVAADEDIMEVEE